MVNFNKDLKALTKRATMIFSLIRENDDTTQIKEMLTDKRYEGVLIGDQYFQKMEEKEKQIKNSHNEIDQEILKKYYKVVEEYYIQYEQIYLYLQKVEAFMDNLGSKYLEFSSIEELLSSNQVDKECQQMVYELIHNYLIMALLIEQQLISKEKERLVVFYYRHSEGKEIKYIQQVRQLTGAVDQKERGPMILCKQMNRLLLPNKLINKIIKELFSQDLYQSNRSPNREYQLLRQNRLISTYMIANLHLSPQYLNTYDINKQYTDFPYQEIYDSLFINVSLIFNKKMPIYNHVQVYKEIEQIYIQVQLYNEYLYVKLSQLIEVVQFIYNANIVIRQYIMYNHFNKTKSKFEMVYTMQTLLSLSVLEMKLNEQLNNQIKKRDQQYCTFKQSIIGRLNQLIVFFSNNDQNSLNVSSISMDESSILKEQEGYSGYFRLLRDKVEGLEIGTDNYVLKQQLIQGQKNVLKYKNVQNNLQIVSYIEQNIEQLQELVLVQKIKENLIGDQYCIDSYLVELLENQMTVIFECLEGGGSEQVKGILYRLSRLDVPNQSRVQAYLGQLVKRTAELVAQQLISESTGRYDEIQLINKMSHYIKIIKIVRQHSTKDPQPLLEERVQNLLRSTLSNHYQRIDIKQIDSLNTFIAIQDRIITRLQMVQDIFQIQPLRFYKAIVHQILDQDNIIEALLNQVMNLLSQSNVFYLLVNQTFYNQKQQEILGAQLIYKLQQVLGVHGLNILDTLLGQHMTVLLESSQKGQKEVFTQIHFQLTTVYAQTISKQYILYIDSMVKKHGKTVQWLAEVLTQIGRMAQLRQLIKERMRLECQKANPQQVLLLKQMNAILVREPLSVDQLSLYKLQKDSHYIGLHSIEGKLYTTMYVRDSHFVFIQVVLLLAYLHQGLYQQDKQILNGLGVDTQLLAIGISVLLDQYVLSKHSHHLLFPQLLQQYYYNALYMQLPRTLLYQSLLQMIQL